MARPDLAGTFGLALRTLRYRTGGFAASFIAMFLGATILMTFASLLDTTSSEEVDQLTADSLVIMASVVGGWGLMIVAFAVLSTLTLLVSQRADEIALLKSIGATPGQVTRMIVGEAAVVAVVASLLAIVPALYTSELVLDLLKDTGQVPAQVAPGFGLITIGMGVGITLIAAVFGAATSARRATKGRVRESVIAASSGKPGRAVFRKIAGTVLLAGGISCGVATATLFTGEEEAVMAIAGQAAILSSIGLALLTPFLLGAITAALAGPLRLTGIGGYLTVLNLRGRTRQMAGVLEPMVLFTGMATGTLYMQSIENIAADGGAPAEMAKTIETLNYVVVGMLTVFAAVMLVNSLLAATSHRRREFGQLRLAGSTPPQVLRMVGTESAVLAATGVLLGTVAALAAVIPYSILRTGSAIPDVTIAIYLAVIAIAVVLTMISSLGAARKAIRPAAVEAAITP